MPKNCGICSDSPCEKETCKRDPFKIKSCKECPALQACALSGVIPEKLPDCEIKDKIEKLVNERRV